MLFAGIKLDAKSKTPIVSKIPLDLDDGLKAIYAKFGNLLTEVKAVTGKE